jgi:hypothetical protein
VKWFSAKIRLACLIEPEGAQRYMDSVYIFRARDFDDAFEAALRIGRGEEEEYLNSDQHRVRWRLKEIISLDQIADGSLDGVEVYSEPVDLEPSDGFPFETVFSPESSTPTQTI